jgi:hypothetical protein
MRRPANQTPASYPVAASLQHAVEPAQQFGCGFGFAAAGRDFSTGVHNLAAESQKREQKVSARRIGCVFGG